MWIQWLRHALLLAVIASPAAALPSEGAPISEVAERYFAVYAEREDFDALMSFYADHAVLEDMIYGHLAQDKASIREFLDWSLGDFSVVDGKPALEVRELVIDGNTAVARGFFNRFVFQGREMGPWRFVIWLAFNEDGKIVRHTDWINYTPRKEFLGGENLN